MAKKDSKLVEAFEWMQKILGAMPCYKDEAEMVFSHEVSITNVLREEGVVKLVNISVHCRDKKYCAKSYHYFQSIQAAKVTAGVLRAAAAEIDVAIKEVEALEKTV